jgi:outer membrane protein
MKKIQLLWCLALGLLFNPLVIAAQVRQENVSGSFTLEECLAFALENRPAVQLANLDEEIAEREIKANLAGWLPQLGVQYNLQHYLKMPVTLLSLDGGPPTPRTLGVANTSTLALQANQTIYNNDVLQASRAARFVRLQNDQNTLNTKINTVVTVSKAFYDVLLTQEQLRILDEAIIRQEKQLKDARAQYEQGLVDKTDFQRASITLANIRSDRKRTQESTKFKLTNLKELMGLAPEKPLQLTYDYSQMEKNIPADTTMGVKFANRIEYQQLQTLKQLQGLSENYYRYGFLPNVSAFANYNLVNQNNQFGDLFNQAFPNALVGLSVGLPIFQGNRRIQNLRRAQLINQSLDIEILNIRSRISSEYDQALGNYKSDLNEWLTTRGNVTLAEDVYRIIKLQYDEGIKTYLDLITAETDLRVTQLNYYNALYRVLASKLDLHRVQGIISVI